MKSVSLATPLVVMALSAVAKSVAETAAVKVAVSADQAEARAVVSATQQVSICYLSLNLVVKNVW
jgi:hypothetical protein